MNNTKINVEFFEKFGELEKLCNDMYSQKHGVSCYIDDMINMQGRYNVKGWDIYLKRLKETRHKRNKLAHGEIGFSDKYALKEDIIFVKQFKKLILKGQDPICLNNKKQKTQKAKKKTSIKKEHSGKTVLIITLLIVLICIIFCVLYNLNH